MKFAENVLLEIVNIVAKGLETGSDVSEELRDIDVELEVGEKGTTGRLELSKKYLAAKGRIF